MIYPKPDPPDPCPLLSRPIVKWRYCPYELHESTTRENESRLKRVFCFHSILCWTLCSSEALQEELGLQWRGRPARTPRLFSTLSVLLMQPLPQISRSFSLSLRMPISLSKSKHLNSNRIIFADHRSLCGFRCLHCFDPGTTRFHYRICIWNYFMDLLGQYNMNYWLQYLSMLYVKLNSVWLTRKCGKKK